MAFVEPITLRDRGVRLEPLALSHEEGLRLAAADGELWKLRVTSVPEPQDTRAYIETALAAVDASLADVINSRVFIQDPADVPRVMDVIGEKFRGIDPATTVTCPPLGSTVYKVELEVTAYRGAGQAQVTLIRLGQ